MYNLIVRSRNHSCNGLRELQTPFRVIYRMGSTTETNVILPKRKKNSKKRLLEINKPEACYISGNKILSKIRFKHGHIPTAESFTVSKKDILNQSTKDYFRSVKFIEYLKKWDTIIAKHRASSGGNNIYLIKSLDDFNDFYNDAIIKNGNNIEHYIFEKYYTYSREYRIHVTKDGCFLADRKMLKNDADIRWHRHANNSVWISENNPLFDKPSNWDDICNSCVNALKAIGLDIAAFDVKVQNNKHETPKWIILESNSAPSLGEISLNVYKTQLSKMIYE